MLDQRLQRWPNIVQKLYKFVVFAGVVNTINLLNGISNEWPSSLCVISQHNVDERRFLIS